MTDNIKKEIAELKIRLRRIERFLNDLPSAQDYLSEEQLNDDELIEESIKIVKQYKKASASLLQRTLSIGYARAARLLDLLEEKGIVGLAEGAKPRKVLLKN